MQLLDLHELRAWPRLQWKHAKDEADVANGAHLNFQTYGNLSSATWRENGPFPPPRQGLSICDVAFSALLSHASRSVIARCTMLLFLAAFSVIACSNSCLRPRHRTRASH